MSEYTDRMLNKLTPDYDMTGLLNYDDEISEADMALTAEKIGVRIAEGTDGSEGASLGEFQDSVYDSFSEADVGRFISVTASSNGNDDIYYIKKFLTSSKVEIEPDLAASESDLVWSLHKEPSMEDVMNQALTQLAQVIDPTYASPIWAQPMPRGFNPCNTDASNTKNEKMSMKVLADNWYGSKTDILDVATEAFAVGDADTGQLILTGLSYADPDVREGLCIQQSLSNPGTYYDEIALASIVAKTHKVTLIDASIGAEFKTAGGDPIYGVLRDGEDGVAEVSQSIFSEVGDFYDVVGAGKAVQLYNGADAGHYFWFNVTDGGDTQTDPGLVGTAHQVDVVEADTSAQVATKFAAIVNALGDFGAPVPGASTVTITNAAVGDATDVSESGTAAAVSVVSQGEDIGTGEGTDVFIKFIYDDAGTPTEYNWQAGDPASVIAYMPQRKCMRNIQEGDRRVIRLATIVGDAELSEDVQNLWSILGITDGENAGDIDLTNTGNYFPFSELTLATATFEDVVNKLNEEIGNRTYTAQNYVTNAETVTESLDALDQALASAGGVKSRIVVRVAAPINPGTLYTIPFATGSTPAIATYKVDSANRGLYMTFICRGRVRTPDSSAVLSDGEYKESSNTQVLVRFGIPTGSIMVFDIFDNA